MGDDHDLTGGGSRGADRRELDVPWTPEEDALWTQVQDDMERQYAWHCQYLSRRDPEHTEGLSGGPFHPVGDDGVHIVPQGEAGEPDATGGGPGADRADADESTVPDESRPISTKAAAKLLRVRAKTLFDAAREDLDAGRPIPAEETGHGTQRRHLRWDPERIEAWWANRQRVEGD